MNWWFRRQLHTQIFFCIVVGAVLGLVLKERVSVIEPVGTVFIRLLQMLVVPLTFLTLVAGMTRLDGIKSLRSLGGMTLLIYAVFSIIATAIGMALALILQPGRAVNIQAVQQAPALPANFDLVDSLVQWVPQNPVEAFATMNMLQIIFFGVVVGIALLAMGQKAERLITLVRDGADLMIRLATFVMKLAPYGILALVAKMVASLKTEMLGEVAKFILTQQISLVVLLVVIYPLALRLLGRVNPWQFYRNVAPAMLVAASTTSSVATLPVSMKVADENLGVPEKVWGFMLPLGATINKNGFASCLGVFAVFSCNYYGMPVTPALITQFLFLGLALSMGTAGVRGAGIVNAVILLQTLHLPTVVLVPILAAIYPILDIGNTCLNVTGGLVATTVLTSRFGMLDKDVFHGGTMRQQERCADRNPQTSGDGPGGAAAYRQEVLSENDAD